MNDPHLIDERRPHIFAVRINNQYQSITCWCGVLHDEE